MNKADYDAMLDRWQAERRIVDEHFSAYQLKERGWTETMIDRLLGKPDATLRNPHNRKWAAHRFWLRERVWQAECSEEFAAMLDRAERRIKCEFGGAL